MSPVNSRWIGGAAVALAAGAGAALVAETKVALGGGAVWLAAASAGRAVAVRLAGVALPWQAASQAAAARHAALKKKRPAWVRAGRRGWGRAPVVLPAGVPAAG